MLDPAPMVRLRALIFDKDARAAFRSLGERGLVHLIQAQAGPESAPLEAPRPGTGPSSWGGLLARAGQLRSGLAIPPAAGEPGEAAPDVEGALRDLEARCADLLARREALRQRREELEAQAARLRGFAGLGLPLDRVGTGAFLHLALGTIPEARLEGLQARLGEAALLLPGPARAERRPLVALCVRSTLEHLDRELQAAGFQAEPLPRGPGGTLDAWAGEVALEAARAAQAAEGLEEELRGFAAWAARPLAALERRFREERNLEEAGAHCPRTATALWMEGWVPEADAPELSACIAEATQGRCVLETRRPAADEEDQVPVLLRPPALLRPFGALVGGFGLPRYREVSPTPFVAVSYLLMFGAMFGDVGHGAVLALAGLGALLLRKGRDAGLLLLGGGVASALFGALYGSCFGLGAFKPLALWRDPLEGDPVGLMLLAMGFGAAMLTLGMGLNILNHLRRRDYLGACLDRFGLAGLLGYWGTLALALGLKVPGAGPWALPALLGGILVLWLARDPVRARLHAGRTGTEREEGGFTHALVDVFETLLVFLANTISFVRLAAYAMSHAALLVATFLVAAAVAQPGGGFGIASALVVVAGNLVAILLEGIIASVQALRLEYYEFFGKFFSGGGRPFAPFRLEPEGGHA